jgi:hypothetical protein
MAQQEADLYDELGFEEAEGFEGFEGFEEGAEGFEEEAEGFEEEMEGFEEEAEGFEEEAEEFEEDSFLRNILGAESEEEFEEGEGFEEFEEEMAYALGAEDSDEFFRRLRRIARRIAPVIVRVARVAAPILSRIPHPYAQIAGRVAGVAGRLLPQAEDEALDAFAELAVMQPRAIPLVAGIAARTILGRRGAMISPTARRAVVRNVERAARTLVRRGGPAAIRALPRIARTVRRTAVVRRTPATARPQVVRRTAARVASSPRLRRRLSRPLPRGRRIARAATRTARRRVVGMGMPGRRFRLRGPVEVTVTSL